MQKIVSKSQAHGTQKRRPGETNIAGTGSASTEEVGYIGHAPTLSPEDDCSPEQSGGKHQEDEPADETAHRQKSEDERERRQRQRQQEEPGVHRLNRGDPPRQERGLLKPGIAGVVEKETLLAGKSTGDDEVIKEKRSGGKRDDFEKAVDARPVEPEPSGHDQEQHNGEGNQRRVRALQHAERRDRRAVEDVSGLLVCPIGDLANRSSCSWPAARGSAGPS